MNLFKIVLAVLFPNKCLGCGEILNEGEFLCEYCHAMIERTAKDKLCLKCGLPKKKCDCSKYIFRFDRTVAPFYYNGIAKRIMYRFKFRHKEYASLFFAQQMALCVKQNYSDIEFSAVTYVPMLKRSELKRGYNQSKLLARDLAVILNLPLSEDLLGVKPKKHTQHKLPLSKRFENVKNKYFCNYSVQGKKILLVDDIKTTGATLDECAKQLLRSGADRVYCVTGLITNTKDAKKKNPIQKSGLEF